MALHPQAGKPERERAGNAENRGRPSGGTDFPLAGPATALECQKKAALADGTKTKETLANEHDGHYAAKSIAPDTQSVAFELGDWSRMIGNCCLRQVQRQSPFARRPTATAGSNSTGHGGKRPASWSAKKLTQNETSIRAPLKRDCAKKRQIAQISAHCRFHAFSA
jgi:hypothetical protein